MIKISKKIIKRSRLAALLIIIAVILGFISQKVLGIVFGVGNIAFLIYSFVNKKSILRKSERTEKSVVVVTLLIMSIVFFLVAFPRNVDNTTSEVSAKASARLVINYIEVGEGDSILIQQDSKTMLIDTGTINSKDTLTNFLKNQKIKKLDYLVLMDAHDNHIGGAEAIIKNFDIGTVYIPDAPSNTKAYEALVSAMKSKGIKASQPKLGSTFNLGKAGFVVYGPVNTSTTDISTYSIVMKMTFGNKKFLFMGNADTNDETKMISEGYDLKADVLKIGNNGSNKSTGETFLTSVKPEYAVISCAKNNTYGYPLSETMKKLKKLSIKVYRTDECDNIECVCDGKNIRFTGNAGDYKTGAELKSSEQNTKSGSSTKTSVPKSVDVQSGTINAKKHVDTKGNGLIKAYTNNKGKKVYCLEGNSNYKNIKAEKMFKTIKEAENAGYKSSK